MFAYLVYKNYVERKTTRRFWVRPFVSAHLLKGTFSSMFSNLRANENKFFSYFRMTVKSFVELVIKLIDKVKSEDTFLMKKSKKVKILR